MNLAYITSLAFLGRALPPWTEGSAHHLAARRRTPSYMFPSKPSRSQTIRRSK